MQIQDGVNEVCSFDALLMERIGSPVPNLGNPMLFCQELTDVLTRNVQFRVVVNPPTIAVITANEQVGIFPIGGQVLEGNPRQREAGELLNGLGRHLAGGDVNMSMDQRVLGFTVPTCCCSVFPNQELGGMKSQTQNVLDIFYDFQKFLLPSPVQL